MNRGRIHLALKDTRKPYPFEPIQIKHLRQLYAMGIGFFVAAILLLYWVMS